MDESAIRIRYAKAVACAMLLLFTASIAFTQDTPMVSPPLTMRPGTTLTVRVNEPLSSDHNQVGDTFSATLTQPVIVLGIVVARYGQTVTGQVVEAKKAGKVSGVSRLGLTLTRLTLVDGQSVPIQSQLVVHQGPTSVERDVAAVAGTTGLGAAVGAAAGWGKGAAIGAGAGAAAGIIGVLLTRGDPAVVGPETLLTFQTTTQVTIATNDAPQAFRFVKPTDYPPAQTPVQLAPAYPPPPPYPYPYSAYYAPPYYPYYPYFYSYYGYPYFYGPSVSFFFGYPGYYGYRHYYYGYPGRLGYGYAPRPIPYHGGTMAYSFHGAGRH